MPLLSLLFLGVRNLGRQPRRTAFTIVVLAAGAVAVLFTRGWRNGMLDLINREGAGTWLGAVQVRPEGAQRTKDAFSLESSVRIDDALLAELKSNPSVHAISPRLRFFGRLYKGDLSAPFVGLGTEVDSARSVVPRLVEADRLQDGAVLGDVPADEILVAGPLAESLGVRVGDTVTLVARPKDGGLEGVDAKVKGIIRAAFEEDQKRAVVTHLATAQRLVRMEAEATSLLLDVKPLGSARIVAAELAGRLKPRGLEAAAWEDINRRHQDAKAIWNLSLGVILAVVALVAALGLLTTLHLVIAERTREIGTLAALGMPRRSVVGLFVVEAALLGALAGIVAAVIGGALVAFVGRVGVRFTPPEGYTVQVRPNISPSELAVAALLLTIVAALVSSLPALKAARRPPVETLR